MELICQIKEVYKALYLYEREFSDQHAITINEAMLLCCLKDGEPKQASDLVNYLGLSNSRVSRVIAVAEEQGYIMREVGAKDRRNMIFLITNKGLEKIKELKDKVSMEGFLKRILPKSVT